MGKTNDISKLWIQNFRAYSDTVFERIPLSYQTFGQPLHTAPVVLVNHALTGNSNVAGVSGWWSDLIGPNGVIDTETYTVLAFNIPGNGYDGFTIANYRDLVAGDVAQLFLKGLEQLGVHELFAVIGGSLGGGIAWEMVALNPKITKHLIPIAADWKSTDWLIANCHIQEQILNNSNHPIADARMHAMLCYRTPESFKQRFRRSVNMELNMFNVESWLCHHGEKLQTRFQLSAYKLMNQLLRTIDITRGNSRFSQVLSNLEAEVHIVAVDSDLFFASAENAETYQLLKRLHIKAHYHEIQSIHGHDAFLIEFDQLHRILRPIFKPSAAGRLYAAVKPIRRISASIGQFFSYLAIFNSNYVMESSHE